MQSKKKTNAAKDIAYSGNSYSLTACVGLAIEGLGIAEGVARAEGAGGRARQYSMAAEGLRVLLERTASKLSERAA